MYKLILDDLKGNTLTFGLGGNYQISEIEGLAPPKAEINLSDTALFDGSKFNSAKVQPRTLQIAFAVENDAEANRLNAYRILRLKSKVRMYYLSDLRNVYIDGYISEIHVTHYAIKQVVTVTIICPQPFFKSAQEVIDELSSIVHAFHFPFSITADEPIPLSYVQRISNVTVQNMGEVDTGLIIEMQATAAVENPIVYNYATKEFLGINYSMQAGDVITFNTMPGEKTVKLLRNAEETNLFNYVMENSTWLQLEGLESTFVYEYNGDPSALIVNFKHYNLFEGV